MDALFEAHVVLSNLPDSAELGVAVMRVAAGRNPSGTTPFRRRDVLNVALARVLMSRGHLAEAATKMKGLDTTWIYADAALIGVVPPDSAAAVFRRRLAGPVSQRLVEAFPWWAGHGDTASLRAAMPRADSAARHGADPKTRSRGRYAAASA